MPPAGGETFGHEPFDAVPEVGPTWELDLPPPGGGAWLQVGIHSITGTVRRLAVNTGACDLIRGTGVGSWYTDERLRTEIHPRGSYL